jgi:hypothetical protein
MMTSGIACSTLNLFSDLPFQKPRHCHHQVLLLHQAQQKSPFFFIHVPEYPQSTFFTNLVSLRAPVRVQ